MIHSFFFTLPWMLLPTIQQDRLSLVSRYPEASLANLLLSREDFRPCPRPGTTDWGRIPDATRQASVDMAVAALKDSWPVLPATLFLDFERTGQRESYQRELFSRRQRLASLVIGESIEAKGRFLDAIANGVWLTCEETYWGVPAHLYLQKKGGGLPDVSEPTVDLFAAETANLLAWTEFLLGDRLDGISQRLRERVLIELDRRILTPCFERNDFSWMGYGGRTVNNWNPWICSNWLTVVLLSERDSPRRVASVAKIMQCLDHFIAGYPDDGGCDEGPGYWGRAAASLFDALELLHLATRGRIDIFDAPLIRAMGRYIVTARLGGDRFLNFADAPYHLTLDAGLLFRFGRAIDDDDMVSLAAKVARDRHLETRPRLDSYGGLGRVLLALFASRDLLETAPSDPLPLQSWLPQTQVLVAREHEGAENGLCVAAKGGHNDESHNHNDVGNFIVELDGHAVIVDAGVGQYTKKTFSSERYSIWTMQSAWHNLPTVNGIQQEAGRAFAARHVMCTLDADHAVVTLDIAGAYPSTSNLVEFVREIRLDRPALSLSITDDFALRDETGSLTWNLLTPLDVKVELEGTISLGDGTFDATLVYTPRNLQVQIDEAPIDDDKLRTAWPRGLRRIRLHWGETKRSGTVTVAIRR